MYPTTPLQYYTRKHFTTPVTHFTVTPFYHIAGHYTSLSHHSTTSQVITLPFQPATRCHFNYLCSTATPTCPLLNTCKKKKMSSMPSHMYKVCLNSHICSHKPKQNPINVCASPIRRSTQDPWVYKKTPSCGLRFHSPIEDLSTRWHVKGTKGFGRFQVDEDNPLCT
jgi:hypothetical protein